MPGANEFLKHVRSSHLALILISAAIAIALSSSDSIYETAAEQLRAVVRLGNALTAEHIAASISKQAEISKAEDKLNEFVVKSLLEYFEVMNIHFDSYRTGYFRIDLTKEEKYGYHQDIGPFEEYYHRFEDDKYWFGWQLCLLSNGTDIYCHPSDLHPPHITEKTTLGDYRSLLNRLMSAQQLYVTPTFHSQYFSRGTLVSKHYEELPDDIQKTLRKMKDVRLSVELTDVQLTDNESRRVFKLSQEAVVEDPAGYDDYNFKFDTFTLDIDADGIDTSLSFSLELPIMFRLQQPGIVADALNQASFDKVYYSRYLAGARSFERLFPELDESAKHLASVMPRDLELHLEEQARSRGAPINLLGLQIRRDLIKVWGILLLLCVQLYFGMHYHVLTHRILQSDGILYPWFGLYRNLVSTLVFQVSLVLPVCICLFIAFGPDSSSHFRTLEVGWLIASLGILFWTEVTYVRFRKMTI